MPIQQQANVDLVGYNGQQVQLTGDFANYMARQGLTPEYMRPFIDSKTFKAYVDVYVGGVYGDPTNVKNYRRIQVNAGTLRRDEWKRLDDAILKISETRLGGAMDLKNKGLTYPLGNAMGTTVLEWHDMSDMGAADMTMDGVTRSQGDRPVFQYNYLPIPIIHMDYEINARALEASRKLGNPLDTVSAERAARKCMEKLEQLFFTNVTYSFGEKDSRNLNTVYSYINHPDRNTVTLSGNWDDSATTPRDIIEDVKAMKQASIDAKHYGPWTLYIPTNYEVALDDDYEDTGNTSTNKTIRQRILEISGINDIVVVDTLPPDNVLLVQMTSDVVRLVDGMGLTNVEWKTEGNMITKYKVMLIQVPQIRSDQNGASGIVHLSA